MRYTRGADHPLRAITLDFGNQDPIFKGTVGGANIDTVVVFTSPTVYLDGVVMCQNNKLNPHLGLGGL